jgi:excinuclease ABC subunit A
MPEPTRQPPESQIVIRGARTHNLKNIDLTLPQERLIIVTGVSGSGKSSLAFDTVYAEGQRRYVESLSAYARQFLERMEKPDVDRIDGICPAIAIRQKNSVRNPRSTVGTTTEIYDYLRLLFARVGRTICRGCGAEVTRETPEAVAGRLVALPEGTRLLVGFTHPVTGEAGEAEKAGDAGPTPIEGGDRVVAVIDGLRRKGFGRLCLEGRALSFDDIDPSLLAGRDALQVVVDRIRTAPDALARLTEAIETAYHEGGGDAFAVEAGSTPPVEHAFSERFECRPCGIAYEVPQPTLFSFNSPFGACPTCHGFGNVIELDMHLVVPDETKSIAQGAIEPWSKPHYRSHLADLKRAARALDIRTTVPWSELSAEERRFVVEGDGAGYAGIRGFFAALEQKKYKVHVRVFLSRYRGYRACADCGGTRLRREARDVQVCGRTVDDISACTVEAAQRFFADLTLSEKDTAIAERIVREIRRRVGFLSGVGLDYLTLDRLSSTLSGGEAQRINLATSLGSSLVGTLYVLDEPSIGLHPRDNERLIRILGQLRDQGNTVLVVEHDADMIRAGDYVVDLGLGAGTRGGRVVYAGDRDGLSRETTSLTAKYLRGDLAIPIPAVRRKRLPTSQALRVRGAAEHNLKGIDVEIPLNMLTCVTGVSGSGKSTLVHDVLFAAVKRAKGVWDKRVGRHAGIDGVELLNDIVLVDQTPIGRTPRSNPVTYLKAFDPIRELFAGTRDARARGFSASHFSFNVPGGRCDACEGEGEVRVEMQFLADVFMPCEQCGGKRFKPQVLEVTWRGLRVDEVLDLTAREALQFFASSPKVVRKLKVLDEIGLGYLRLGQPATTLSGGEAQRIKIAAHLAIRHGEQSLYIFDEPTTGLHFDDISKLLAAFAKLVEAGHTLLVIEHNLDVIKTADWLIDLGPEGGEAGGEVVVAGPPELVAGHAGSHTGRYLRDVLAGMRALA